MSEKGDTPPDKEAAPTTLAELPLLKRPDAKTRRLLKLGKKRGFILFDELNALLPGDVTTDEIEALYDALNEMGINVIESEAEDDEATEFDSTAVMPTASTDLEQLVRDTMTRFADATMPFSEYQATAKKLSWLDRSHFEERLAALNFVLTDAVKGPDGGEYAAAIQVIGICPSFSLTKLRGRADNLPLPPPVPANAISTDPLRHSLRFKVPIEPSDEIWGFSSSQDSWNHLAGRAGLALVRGRTVIDAYVTIMS